jgi:Wyosine base formation.
MNLGHSVYKLTKDNMLRHSEVREWSMMLLKALRDKGMDYVFMDEDPNSRITVLQNMKRYVDRWIEKPTNP